MKILLLIPALGSVYGGTSKITPAFAAALGRRGWAVDVITTHANGRDNLAVPLDGWVEQDQHRTRYFPRFGTMEFKPSISLLNWLFRHAGDYDLVHITSNFNFPVLAAALACRLRGVSYILNPQGMLEPWALGYKAWKKRAYYLGVERPFVLGGAVAIQALNTNEATNIEALQIGPATVTLPNGINPSEATACGPAQAETFLDRFPMTRGKELILFLHRIDPKKGLDILAKAYRQVRERFPQTHLIVAGPDTTGYTASARGFFEAGGCADAVTFTGLLEGEMKCGALAAASIFVAPSYSEGFSMSVLEAMAASLPCVLTEGCNFPEAGEEGAASIVPIDADAFSVALQELLGDRTARERMGAKARDLVLREYTWDQIAIRFEAICQDLLPSIPMPR